MGRFANGQNENSPIMPLMKGKIDVTSGDVDVWCKIHCEEDGDIILHWPDGTTTTKHMTTDYPDRAFTGKVTVVSGRFDFH